MKNGVLNPWCVRYGYDVEQIEKKTTKIQHVKCPVSKYGAFMGKRNVEEGV